MTAMPPPSSRRIGIAAGTLHVADALSEPVFSVLGPATATLQQQGLPQAVVALDHAEHAPRLARVADGVHLTLVPLPRPRWRRWLALREAVRRELQAHPPQALHFHDPWAWLWCRGLRPLPPRVYVSPPDTALLRHARPLLRALAALVRLRRPPGRTERALATGRQQAAALRGAGIGPPVVEGAVAEAFFDAVPQPARRALVVAGCHEENRKAIELFCRAAVVFGAAELDLAFNWCGPVSTADRQRLAAAGIGCAAVDDAHDEAAVAARLRPAWVVLAGGGERGFAVRLAQAMACGLPCLAADLPAHRDLIDDGVTGLLYRSEDEALQLMGQLLDDAALRDALGSAARAAALARFTPQRVGETLLALYRAPGPTPPPDDADAPAGEVQGA
jgi:hypothetical protein